jgi:hypothetical protein
VGFSLTNLAVSWRKQQGAIQKEVNEAAEELREVRSKLGMALREVSDEFSQVLYGGNEQILDGLAPKATPASALQAMTVSSVCKTAFHQMLAAFEITLCRLGLGDFAGLFQ